MQNAIVVVIGLRAKILTKKSLSSCEKSRKSSSVAAENTAAGLTARRCDIGLTSTWFQAAFLDVNGLPDLPHISMNVI